MSTTTNIEWTQKTWNPTTGCDRVSTGCDHCYALTLAKRLKAMGQARYQADGDPRTSGPGFALTLHPESISEPLGWRKPSVIFVNSMSDLFHAKVPYEFVERVWTTMAETPRHTYQILTKRPDRMERFVTRLAERFGVLPNVWLGTSVESQEYVGRAVRLAGIPAAVRFLSVEPMLGPVDLTTAMPPLMPAPLREAPAVWAEWTWDEWVPVAIREQIEHFWADSFGRGPIAWLRDMRNQGAHAHGAVIESPDGFRTGVQRTTGRYVHCWNNIGRLVRDDGSWVYTSFTPDEVLAQRPFHWVIVGGESGHGARPCEMDWLRSLRDQCQAAGVAFFLKQLGSVAMGGRGKGAHLDAVLDGRRWTETPAGLSVVA